ncbi:hypothetical protein KAR91_67490 [Candidatus Pacearchaeota archaeon]|nr:hypothetical protein [Candidatus Pacearchaeota archaeon]
MKGFKKKIYLIGNGGNIFPIPPDIITKLDLKAGEYLYCYLNKSENLTYSREQRKKIPVGRYKVTADRKTLRVYLHKAWMDFHGLKHTDIIDVKCNGKEIIVSNGGNNGKE